MNFCRVITIGSNEDSQAKRNEWRLNEREQNGDELRQKLQRHTEKPHFMVDFFLMNFPLETLILRLKLRSSISFFIPPSTSSNRRCQRFVEVKREMRIEIRYHMLVDLVLMTVTKIPGNLLIYFSFSSTTEAEHEGNSIFFRDNISKIRSGGNNKFQMTNVDELKLCDLVNVTHKLFSDFFYAFF